MENLQLAENPFGISMSCKTLTKRFVANSFITMDSKVSRISNGVSSSNVDSLQELDVGEGRMHRATPRLLAIELSGFQVFRDPVRVPIAPITLLFGPNSAGKSSLVDAFRLLHSFWTPPPPQMEPANWDFARGKNRQQSLSRDWRLAAGNHYEDRPLCLGVSIEIPRYRLFDAQLMTEKTLSFELLNDFDSMVNLEATVEFSPPFLESKVSIFVKIDGEVFYEFREGEIIRIRTDHPVLGESGLSLPLCKTSGIERSAINLNNWAEALGNLPAVAAMQLDDLVCNVLSANLQTNRKRLKNQRKDPFSSEYFARTWWEFQRAHNLITGRIAILISNACQLDLVPASRQTPSESDLQVGLDKDGKVVERVDASQQNRLSASYRSVVKSAAIVTLNHCGELKEDDVSDIHAGSGLNDPSPFNQDHQLISSINESLSKHLHTDRGYRIDCDVTKLVPLDGQKVAPKSAQWLAHLRICDSSGRRMSFNDVGSGLGYVFPVLVSLWTTETCFLQQPELHLHPALQASLADAFIDAIRADRIVIVETHSEHLLLRLLRRIRQTNANAELAGETALFPHELSVVYFDPTGGTDTTRLVALGVTNTGEFIGRWPAGFFTERDEELFGE